MSSWGDAKIFFCILFITCCCCTVTEAQVVMDCCLTVKNQTIDKSATVDYRRQISGQGCSIDAMILVTRGGHHLCVPANEPWVQVMVKHVEAKKKRCKKSNYKGKGCNGMKPKDNM